MKIAFLPDEGGGRTEMEMSSGLSGFIRRDGDGDGVGEDGVAEDGSSGDEVRWRWGRGRWGGV